jgi:hypothetical protein
MQFEFALQDANLAEPSGHRSGGSAEHLCRSPITDQPS